MIASATRSEGSESDGEFDNQPDSSLGASRDLLNNENDLDSRGDDWDEARGEAKASQGDNAMSGFFNESESKKLPGAIIIGVKKGGTRALLEFLRAHPDIRAVGAEPHFFDRNYDKGLEWYRYITRPVSAPGLMVWRDLYAMCRFCLRSALCQPVS